MTFNVDEFLSERTQRTESVPILVRSDLIEEVKELRRQHREAVVLDERENRIPEAPKLQKQIDKVNKLIDESAQWFKFGEIGRYDYEKLLRRHQPKGADKAAEYMWDPDEFPPALIAAASLEPKLTPADAIKLYKQLPKGDADRLFRAAMAPQLTVGDFPLPSSGTGQTPTTGGKSGTADPEESPDPDS